MSVGMCACGNPGCKYCDPNVWNDSNPKIVIHQHSPQQLEMQHTIATLTSENAELREKWHSFSKATLGEWAELKKERDTLKEEVAELRESAKRADLWKDRSE